jgi:hypothetical protein
MRRRASPEVVAQGFGGGDDVGSGLDLDAPVAMGSTRTVESCIDPTRAPGWVSSTTGVIGVPRLLELSQRESAATGSLTCSLGDRPFPSRIGKRALRDLPYLSICTAIHSSPRI